MRNLDFSSWEGILSTLAGLVLITVIGVGIRLLAMHTIQQRRERENRQINERLRTLIAAYKTLGGSFTGNLEVDPTHLRDLRRRTATANTSPDQAAESVTLTQAVAVQGNGDRSRRVRDAVEAALSDIILLVRMAAVAATELVAGRPIHTAELVTSLRDFIRAVLDLDPVPAELSIPKQGPVRPSSSGGGKGDKGDSRSAGKGGGAGGDGAGGGSASHSDSWQEPHH